MRVFNKVLILVQADPTTARTYRRTLKTLAIEWEIDFVKLKFT